MGAPGSRPRRTHRVLQLNNLDVTRNDVWTNDLACCKRSRQLAAQLLAPEMAR